MAEVREAIVRAAQEAGVDPAFALSVADRESGFNPRARNSKSIFGLFQMTGYLRNRYGVGDSTDPYEQARGWSRFITDVKRQMGERLGREPTNEEAYTGHHFGAGRAASILSGNPNTDVRDVFTPYELSLNPHIRKAGSTGNLAQSVIADMSKRYAKFGGQSGSGSDDFSSYGEEHPVVRTVQEGPVRTVDEAPRRTATRNPRDFSQFGEALDAGKQAAAPGAAPAGALPGGSAPNPRAQGLVDLTGREAGPPEPGYEMKGPMGPQWGAVQPSSRVEDRRDEVLEPYRLVRTKASPQAISGASPYDKDIEGSVEQDRGKRAVNLLDFRNHFEPPPQAPWQFPPTEKPPPDPLNPNPLERALLP